VIQEEQGASGAVFAGETDDQVGSAVGRAGVKGGFKAGGFKFLDQQCRGGTRVGGRIDAGEADVFLQDFYGVGFDGGPVDAG
jgi:hypothetical protein